jgi:acyl carrier protein
MKIRGYRIELGEIEAALGACAGVREAVALVREDRPGEKRLAACLVAEPGSSLKMAELRRRLKERLPDYMIPAVFMALESLPLTPNGKIDRRKLAAEAGFKEEIEGEYTAPRNDVEEVVAGSWAETLGVERIGVFDNFFDLGGHSLLATQLVARLRKDFNAEISLRTLIELGNVAEVSQALIAGETEPGRITKIARILKLVRNMSPEQVEESLSERRKAQ